jgi:D-glycero-D-manno-heptose 1,7-bisphosphate phosphatase
VPPSVAFIDRDGTINRKAPDGDYVKSVDELVFLPGAVDGLRTLTAHGVRIVIVTNQRGIALGRMTESDLAGIHRAMVSRLSTEGVVIEAIYHCPHGHGQCSCRKPEIGMFMAAAQELPNLDLAESAVIGDSEADMKAAERLGVPSVLVGGAEVVGAPFSYRAASVADAARWLIEDYQRPSAIFAASRQRIETGSAGQRSAIAMSRVSGTGSPAPRR